MFLPHLPIVGHLNNFIYLFSTFFALIIKNHLIETTKCIFILYKSILFIYFICDKQTTFHTEMSLSPSPCFFNNSTDPSLKFASEEDFYKEKFVCEL